MSSTQNKLNGRERVARAFRREPIDRVPRLENPWVDTIRAWQQQGHLPADSLDAGFTAFANFFEYDFQRLTFYWPQPFPGHNELIEETDTYRRIRNPFGSVTREWKHHSGVPGHDAWECDGPDIWKEKYLPAFSCQEPQINIGDMRRNMERAEKAGRWRNIAMAEIFEVLRQMIGDEAFMINTIEEPGWIAEMAETIIDTILRNLEWALQKGIRPDGLWVYGDMAFKTGPFCSPASYKELIQPAHKRLVDWAHARDLKVIYHTDGDFRLCIDPLMRAGFDAFHPLECNAGMQVAELAPHIGDRVLLIGNVSAPVLERGDPDEVEAEMLAKLRAGMEHHCYVYQSDHSVSPQVSWDTIVQVKCLLDTAGRYEQAFDG
ncbi:MAG: uroporphyrinogen decarboxylase family protein [Oceanipulchritudo sp.]